MARWPLAPRGHRPSRSPTPEPTRPPRCRQGGGEPATPHRGGARRPSAPRRPRRLRGARARTPGHRLPHRVPVRGLGRRGGGGRAGGVRQGVARAAAVPGGRAVPSVAARHRRQRGAQPPPRRRPARRARGPRRDGAGLGGRGSVPRGRAPCERRAPGAARRARGARRARPRRDRLPLPARPLRARDGRGPRVPARDRKVAAVARARADAGRARAPRRGGGARAVNELEQRLALLRDDVAWPPTPDLASPVAARIASEPPRRSRARWPALRPATVALAAFAGAFVVAATLAAAPGVRARIAPWLRARAGPAPR